tara:strand:- start:33100 stop:33282 length:183 start_codon:yes stop_codon:yes gene_type:complete
MSEVLSEKNWCQMSIYFYRHRSINSEEVTMKSTKFLFTIILLAAFSLPNAAASLTAVKGK